MALGLDTKCKARLIQLLSEDIPHVQIYSGVILDRETVAAATTRAEKALPQNSQEIKTLIDLVGESPMQTFVDCALTKFLKDHAKYDPDAPVRRLEGIPGFNIPEQAAQLVTDFDSLPWRYAVSVPLPSEAMTELPRIPTTKLGPSLSLITANSEFESDFPLPRSAYNRLANLFAVTPEWIDGGHYLQFEAEGLCGFYDYGIMFERAKSSFLSFIGLGIALNLFTVGYKLFDLPPPVPTAIHRATPQGWQFQHAADLAESDSKLWQNVELSKIVKSLQVDERPPVIKSVVEKIGRVFATGERARQILLAAEWLFHSHKSGDELLAFVRSMIILEILLGEKEQPEAIGLGELLRNRCAYLIGKNQEDRQQILEDFKKIYTLRSQIVHRGKSHLSPTERKLFWKLKQLCISVLREEIRLLEAPKA